MKKKHDASVVYENDRYNNTYDEDYDDEVFATFNS